MDNRRQHHYVPCVYLKNFANATGQVCVYRLLVGHPKVPGWRYFSPRGIAYHAHLYARMIAGSESNDVEDWLSHEFEAPAERAIRRVVRDETLTRKQWRSLIRFVAAQDVRTPARLLERMAEWQKTGPALLNEVVREAVSKLTIAKQAGTPIQRKHTSHSEYLPLRVHKEVIPGKAMGKLRVETVIGRGFWLFTLKHLLTSTLNTLMDHDWTIMKPHNGIFWFTSDDPVIKLNYFSPENYTFEGGWGSKGTEIILPLSPTHLLYTQVGNQSPLPGSTFSLEQSVAIQRIIAEHAHRMIFSHLPSPTIASMRIRTVSSATVKSEQQQWENWHEDQAKAERELKRCKIRD